MSERSVYRWLRRTPLGVLAVGTALSFVGAGMLLGGAYLALTRGDSGWMVWLTACAVGPLLLYVAVHVLRLTHWAWLALVLLLSLLMATAAWRVVVSPRLRAASLAELAVEAAALAYLRRPSVRRAFHRS